MEILIADLTIDDERLLGGLARNPDKIPLPSCVNYQSAHIDGSKILVDVDDDGAPTTIAADLLQKAYGPDLDDPINSIAPLLKAGSAAISFNDNDGKTWGLLQILKTFGHTKILSHPHIISKNNTEAIIEIGEQNYVAGGQQGDPGVATTIAREFIEAKLKVIVTPRISAVGEVQTVNLTVEIDINDFTGVGDSRTTRKIKTNANVVNGSILALGGLIKTTTENSTNETPLLSKVPIIGWFFKKRSGSIQKNNLTVFIRPTIIQPRLREGASIYTQDYIDTVKDYAKEGMLFDTLKEPITRWFFKTDVDAHSAIASFVKKDELKSTYNTDQKVPSKSARKRMKKKKKELKVAQPNHQREQELKKLIQEEKNPLLNVVAREQAAPAQS